MKTIWLCYCFPLYINRCEEQAIWPPLPSPLANMTVILIIWLYHSEDFPLYTFLPWDLLFAYIPIIDNKSHCWVPSGFHWCLVTSVFFQIRGCNWRHEEIEVIAAAVTFKQFAKFSSPVLFTLMKIVDYNYRMLEQNRSLKVIKSKPLVFLREGMGAKTLPLIWLRPQKLLVVRMELELTEICSARRVMFSLHHRCSVSRDQSYLERSHSINITDIIGCGLTSMAIHQFGSWIWSN